MNRPKYRSALVAMTFACQYIPYSSSDTAKITKISMRPLTEDLGLRGKPYKRDTLNKIKMRFPPLLVLLCVSALASAEPAIDLVRVLKAEHKLQLLSSGKVVNEFPIALGGNPKGHKTQEGDGRTPEGIYTLDFKKADSAFHKAFHISYPNADDVASAKSRGVNPGGAVMIHGQKNGLGWLEFISQRFDWTNGCVALRDEDLDILWASVREGTKVEIRP